MVKTHLETLTEDILAVVNSKTIESKTLESKNAESSTEESENTYIKNIASQNNQAEKQDKIWLDIEIESAEYLLDLSARIEQIVKEMPVEVLLVRRSKKARQQMPSHEKKVTLSELSVQEVFDARLALEPWQTDEQQQRKTRLNSLYLNIAEHTQLASSTKRALTEHSEADTSSTNKAEAK
jgi:exonuclease SbcD